jgi:phosphatidate cytidylyltransferase
VGFFLLRNINNSFFDLFVWFLSFMGAFEVARAVKPFTLKGTFILALIFGATFTPLYVISNYFFAGDGVLFALNYLLLFSVGIAIYALAVKANANLFAVSILPIIYPAILLLSVLTMNDFDGAKGLLALILIFVISPCSDVMAYLVGMTYSKIKKGNAKKLCPKLSPNKTVAGAIGGTIGGAIGALIIYFIFKEKALTLNTTVPALIFILVGLVGSVLTIIGDLFESSIKRKVGIKDMGKIMPGHGGVMDRIDGMVFCSVLVCIVFLFI